MSKNKDKKNISDANFVLHNQNKLRFWERAILAIEAEHITTIYSEENPILFQTLKKELLSLHIEDKGNATKQGIEEKINENFKKICATYHDIRNYLNHIKHTDRKIELDYELCDVLCKLYKKAYTDRIKVSNKEFLHIDERFFEVDREYFFKKCPIDESDDKDKYGYYFTLFGLVMFFCMSLEIDRAYQLRDKFYFTNPKKANSEVVVIALESVIQKYSRKKSDKIKIAESHEVQNQWNLFVEILDYIRKPIKHSPNYDKQPQKNRDANKKKEKKFDKRTTNKYVTDNLIIKWIELGKKLPKLEFAKTKQIERKIENKKRGKDKTKNIKIPEFEKSNKKKGFIDEYFEINGMYWCRIKINNESQKESYMYFKMHKVLLRRLAKKILEGKEERDIISSIRNDIEVVKTFNEEAKILFDDGIESSLTLKSSLPRSNKEAPKALSLGKKIKKRIEYYEKILENPFSSKYDKAYFILWAFQRPLWETKKEDKKNKLKLDEVTYQNINKSLCYYSIYSTLDFQKEVQKEIPNKCKYLRDYIKHDIEKTFECVVNAAKEKLEEDEKNMMYYSIKGNESLTNKVLFTNHSLRFKKTQKEKHPFSEIRDRVKQKNNNEEPNIVWPLWLSKHWGLSYEEQKKMERRVKNFPSTEIRVFYHKYIENSKAVSFDPNNYHAYLQRDESKNTLQLNKTKEEIKKLPKEEKKFLYNALKYYENDMLLLEIATRCIDDINKGNKLYVELGKKEKKKNGQLEEKRKDFDLSLPSPEVIIKENRGSQGYSIPLRYLIKLSFIFGAKNLIKGIKLINNNDEAILKNKRPDKINDIEYFMQILLPKFKLLSTIIIQKLFEIEHTILFCEKNSIEGIDYEKRENLLEKVNNKQLDYISFDSSDKDDNGGILDLIDTNKLYYDRDMIKHIRNNVAHEDLGDLLVSEKYDKYIKSVDDLAEKFGCKTVTNLIESYKYRREEKFLQGVEKDQSTT